MKKFTLTRIKPNALSFLIVAQPLILAPAAHSAVTGVPTTASLTIVDSSSSSWVARGYQDYTVSPELGWSFSVSRNFDNGVSFRMEGTPVPGTDVTRWSLDFAAPGNALLVTGLYADFQRYPFQAIDRPGMGFGSTGRGDNTASGFFEVLEATYGPSGEVLEFAVDFTHYGETNPANFAVGELRYSVIPEPSAVLLLLSTASMVVFRRKR